MEAAEGREAPLWLVGGALRDYAAAIALRDVDLSVDGDAAEIARAVAEEVGGEPRCFPRFGTATIRLGESELDIASLRHERYVRAAALPAVEIGATLEQDLARRDFSVNAIALGLTGPRRGELVDPYRGIEDLAARRLRVLHPRSFIDDPTRLWRAARYSARLRLRPTPETAALIAAGGRWLRGVSARRLWVEFRRGAVERRVAAVLGLLDEWGVLRATAPGFALASQAGRALRHRPGPHDPSLLLALMLAPLAAAETVLKRLAPPREARRAVADARLLLALSEGDARTQEPPMLDAALLEEIEGAVEAGLTAARWLDPERQRPLQRSRQRWRCAAPLLAAEALARLGVPRGPVLGRMLRRLRRERYLGTLSSAAEARRFVERALREGKSDD